MNQNLEIIDIAKSFGRTPILSGISLECPRGSITTILGTSGCGKSTLLKIIAGLLKPNSGQIKMNGVELTNTPAEKRNIPIVLQDYGLFPHMSVSENVAFGLKQKKLSSREVQQETYAMLEVFDLSEHADKHPHELSGGQQQRVAFARALVLRSEILLLDEPFSNLDMSLRRKLQESFIEIKNSISGLTVINVTHDQEEALAISDYVAVMENGKIIQTDTPEQIYYHPNSEYAAIATGVCNFIPITSIKSGPRGINVATRLFSFLSMFANQDSKYLIVRPENVSICSPGKALFCGVIKSILFSGHITHVVLVSEGLTIRTEYSEIGIPMKKGDIVGVDINLTKVAFV